MYAVFESGGKQHRVSAGETVTLERLNAVEGSEVTFEKVLMIDNNGDVAIGNPFVKNGKVTAKILSHGRDKKVRVIKFKRRKNYLRRHGHRQHHTVVEVLSISNGDK